MGFNSGFKGLRVEVSAKNSTPDNKTTPLSRNVRCPSPSDEAPHLERTKKTAAPFRKPKTLSMI